MPDMPDILKYFMEAMAIIFSAGGDIKQAYEDWKAEDERVKQMVKENRDPTKEEWDALLAKSQANTDEINKG